MPDAHHLLLFIAAGWLLNLTPGPDVLYIVTNSLRSGARAGVVAGLGNIYVAEALLPHYGADCPVVVVYRATWPDEEIILTSLTEMRARVRDARITRTALVFVGRVFGEARFRDSRLYAQDFAHVLRNAGKKKSRAAE